MGTSQSHHNGASAIPPPPPLTQQRIRFSLDSKGYSYRIDSDGDIGGNWDGRTFYFFQYGDQHEILQIRSRWNYSTTQAHVDTLQQFCNDWNRDRIWPKVYARAEENNEVGVFAELSTDLECGVTNEQLDQIIACALGTSTQFYNQLEAEFKHIAI